MSDPLQFDVQAVLARRISRQNRSKDAPNRSALRWDTLARSQNHSSFISSEITLSNTFGGKTLYALEQEKQEKGHFDPAWCFCFALTIKPRHQLGNDISDTSTRKKCVKPVPPARNNFRCVEHRSSKHKLTKTETPLSKS